MHARCPKCGTIYELSAAELGGAARAFLTCAACGDTFFYDRTRAERLASASPAANLERTMVGGTPPAANAVTGTLDKTQIAKAAAGQTASGLKRPRPDFDPHDHPPRAPLTLYVLDGHDRGLYYEVSGREVPLGRSAGGIVVPDGEVSRHHARIERVGSGVFYVRDLDSTNGTYVNEAPVQYWQLEDLDILRLGATHLLVRIAEPHDEGRG